MLGAAFLISLVDAGANATAMSPTVSTTQKSFAIVIAAALLAVAWWTTINGKDPKKDIGLFVGYISFFAIVCGACFIAIATTSWATVLLIAGGCLGAGFIFGLLSDIRSVTARRKPVVLAGRASRTSRGRANRGRANRGRASRTRTRRELRAKRPRRTPRLRPREEI